MQEPTNRELKIMIDNLTDKLNEKIVDMTTILRETRDDVKEIKTQTQKTNGRVNKHEIWMKAFWWFFGFLGTILITALPLLRYIEKTDIKQAVSDALGQYNIIVK